MSSERYTPSQAKADVTRRMERSEVVQMLCLGTGVMAGLVTGMGLAHDDLRPAATSVLVFAAIPVAASERRQARRDCGEIVRKFGAGWLPNEDACVRQGTHVRSAKQAEPGGELVPDEAAREPSFGVDIVRWSASVVAPAAACVTTAMYSYNALTSGNASSELLQLGSLCVALVSAGGTQVDIYQSLRTYGRQIDNIKQYGTRF